MNNLSFIQFIDTHNTQYTVPTHMIHLEDWRKGDDDTTCYVYIRSRSIKVSWDTYNQIINALRKQYTVTSCNAG